MQTHPITRFGLLIPFLTTIALGQGAAPPQPIPNPIPVRKRTLVPGSSNQESSGSNLLSSNFRLTFSGASGEKNLGQLSVLTSSQSVQVSGPLSAEDPNTVFSIQGTLSEKEGALVFTYSIRFTVRAQQPAAGEGKPTSQPSYFVDHTASGTLRMNPGEVYEVLKSGGNAYTVSISPETKP
jgi:hypothetical protein